MQFENVKTIRRLYPMTRERSEGQTTPTAWFARAWGSGSSLLANFSVWQARASKNPIFWKIQNKYFYWPYSNKIFYTKALEYKEYFTSVDLWQIPKSSKDIQVFLDMKYRMFGQAASKYAIILVCVMLLRHLTPRSKGYFMRISTVVSVLKGCIYSSRYFHQKQLNEKYQISRWR
jgi:hypothetical protein